MRLNLHLLRIFHRVAEQRSFSRAAVALHISQPAVSKAVRELESQLALPLLERGTAGAKGVRLTESGHALFEHARGIFALERAALDDIRARVGRERGTLTLGASTTIAGYWLPTLTARLMSTHPDIELRVVVGNTQAIAARLIDCELDLALVEGPVHDPRIALEHWRDEPLRIVARHDDPFARKRQLDAAQLSTRRWLLREPGSGTRDVAMDVLSSYAISLQQSIEFGSNEGIAHAVAQGLGIALLPECVVRDLARLGEVRYLRHPASQQSRPLYRMKLRERPESPLMQTFSALLRQETA